MNVEFHKLQNSRFCHFSRILNHRSKNWKYASFERVQNAVTPLFYRHLGIKKALIKSAIFINSRITFCPKLVQNVKNQFFHKLSCRCIWGIQTLTFGVNLSHFLYDLHHLHSRVVSHTRHIVLGLPWIFEFQPVCNALLALIIWRVKRNH